MRDKGIATAVATLLAAFATAHLMQFGLSAGRALSGEQQSPPIGLATFMASRTGGGTPDLPPTPSPVADPAAVALRLPDTRAAARDAAVPAALASARERGFGQSCARTLGLTTLPGAIVEARVHAPCDPHVRVEIDHAGLRFAVATDAAGRATVHVPALKAAASVEAAFADGARVLAHADVPGATQVERVALVADGWTGLTLHAARPFARHGVRGDAGPDGRDAAILRLGDPAIDAPLLAEVYTSPNGRFGPLDAADLRVEAALSPANCARDVAAEVVRSSGGARPLSVALRLSLPACDGDGGVLVLDLPSPGLRLARN
jgi:hypothetical protein